MIYKTQGTCSTEIHIEAKDGIIESIRFTKGCPGNLLAVAALTKGRPIKEVIGALQGIKCGTRETSCPDQLATALRSLV